MWLATLPLLFLGAQETPQSVVGPSDFRTTEIAGLENSDTVRTVSGTTLKVQIRRATSETNATQITLGNTMAVRAGDVMMATLVVRGSRPGGGRAQVEFMFEKSTSPWTKSITQSIELGPEWRTVAIPFRSALDHPIRDAMASLRLAFGPQTVEIREFRVERFSGVTLEEMQQRAATTTPLGNVQVAIDRRKPRQRMVGLGGNFCQPRYGSSEAMDAVGTYALQNLRVRHARVGLPLNHWAPRPGEVSETGPAKASLEALQILAKRKIPLVVSVWEGPSWLVGGQPEQSGKVLPKDRYAECATLIAKYLQRAKTRYGAEVEYFSFNEADYGVNFKFTPETFAAFVRVAGPIFAEHGLRTKFLVGDTANGSNCAPYIEPLLRDASLRKYLGPIAFHSWDALSATEKSYRAIADLGRKYKKPIWCLEAGHDAQLWQAKDPWGTWDNALRNALAYARTVNLTECNLLDYWTYQDNYALVDPKSVQPYPAFRVMSQMEQVLDAGSIVLSAKSSSQELQVVSARTPSGMAAMLVNPIGPGKVSLSGLLPNAPVTLVVSTSEGQLRSDRMFRKTGARGEITVNLPARSVVVVKVSSARQ